MIIRHFEEHDLPALTDLLRTGMAEIGATLDEEKLKRHIKPHNDESGLGLVIVIEKDVEGAAAVVIHEQFAEISQMFLSKKLRGEGKGKFLLDMLLNFSKNHDCKRVVIFLNPGMKDAIDFCKRNNFVEVANQQNYVSYAPKDRKIPFVLEL
ncbi:GNAT family N-acetyltransferase [Bdellovibrionota bacterium]